MPFYMRGIPFYTGMLAALIVEEMKKREYKLSKVHIICYILVDISYNIIRNFNSVISLASNLHLDDYHSRHLFEDSISWCNILR